jgi:ribosomal protein L20
MAHSQALEVIVIWLEARGHPSLIECNGFIGDSIYEYKQAGLLLNIAKRVAYHFRKKRGRRYRK